MAYALCSDEYLQITAQSSKLHISPKATESITEHTAQMCISQNKGTTPGGFPDKDWNSSTVTLKVLEERMAFGRACTKS